MKDSCEIVIIGAGQAGLALSHHLRAAGREHVILERGRVGQSWRDRWDSFCLVLPNWTVTLPGGAYQGPDPDGFMARDDFVAYISDYARSFGAPVHEGVAVETLEHGAGGGFLLQTSDGPLRCRQVVVATGGFQRPHRPTALAGTPDSVRILDVSEYTNPQALPGGAVVVVGSGQSGCQIAEELREAGREVVLSCGRAPWQPRRIGDRDTFAWVAHSRLMAMTLKDLPSPAARLGANPQATGRDGGHDLHYRTLQAMGVVLAGHLLGVEDGRLCFAADLADCVAFGDARYDDLRTLVAERAHQEGVPVPEMPAPPRFDASHAPTSLDLSRVGAIVVAAGFRPGYASWVRIPDALDAMGFPVQADGSSTVVPGLHFMGVHFQRSRASATLMGVGDDAAVLADRMARVTLARS